MPIISCPDCKAPVSTGDYPCPVCGYDPLSGEGPEDFWCYRCQEPEQFCVCGEGEWNDLDA